MTEELQPQEIASNATPDPVNQKELATQYMKGFCDGLTDAGNMVVHLSNMAHKAKQTQLRDIYKMIATTMHQKSNTGRAQLEKVQTGGLIT